MHTFQSLALVLAALGSTVPTSPPRGDGTPAATPKDTGSLTGPRVVLEGLAGDSSVRALASFETSDPRTLGAHLVRFEGAGALAPIASKDTADVRLGDGERLVGALKRGGAESLDVEVAGGVHVSASLDDIRSVTFAARIPSTWNAPLERAGEGDRLYRRKNETIERIDGGVEEFGEAHVKFHDARIGSLEIAWGDVVALFVESAKSAPPLAASGAVPIVVDLVDKSRIKGTLSKIDAQGVVLQRSGGEALRFSAAASSLVMVDDGRIAFLSDLAPSKSEPSRPFGDDLGMRWPHVLDASVTGTPLVVGGKTFARGIGVHAPSRLTWSLDGSYEGLRGFVGVDDAVLRLAARGSVRFRVIVDGVKRFESRVLGGGDAPVPIALEPKGLAGAKELVLEVDMSDDSFVADRADWLQVILVRGVDAK